MEKIAISTFCYGERYYNQVNRMISEINSCDFKPTIVVVTDDITKILDKPFVKVYDISDFNPEYKNYNNSYYDFDFSVKRYSVLAALNLGFTKIILTDADAIPNKQLFNEEYIMKGFVKNSIQGQVTYNFSQQVNTNSELGKRFLEYEKYFNVSYNKNNLDFMPEDCIQFLDIEMPKFYNFLRIWDECIRYKKLINLSNTPAGNIDEMCFSALNCGLSVGNNSDKCMNALTPIHDKWYDSTFSSLVIEPKPQKRKIVLTSIYELFYIQERGSGLYKSFPLLTQTIRNIIFDDFEYIIYTDKSTYEKYNLPSVFPQSNVTFRFVELNSDYYLNVLKPIKEKQVIEGEIWDRIHSVENYIEVIYNKLEFMLQESNDENSMVVWIDSGLFGTSCSNGWRDYMNDICHTKNFINKIFEKIETYDFISLLGNSILVNYEIKEKINNRFNTNLKIVPGCLFGGHSNLIKSYLGNYKEFVLNIIQTLNDYTSEQEILYLCFENKNIKFFDFEDWDDLQKGMLKIMDNYDETKYDTHLKYSDLSNMLVDNELIINEDNFSLNFETNIKYPLSDSDILEKIISVSTVYLNKLDLSHNDYMLKNMSDFANYYHYPSGQEHYRLLSFISKLYNNETIYDIGTNNGCSAIALSENNSNVVKTYDIVDYKNPGAITKPNIIFYLENIVNNINVLNETRFIMLDTNHDGVFENIFYNKLKEIKYKGLLFLDDIHLNSDMKKFWSNILEEKYDLTIKGHNTGSGLIVFK